MALGRSANATGRGAVALGQYTKASNTNAVAEGNNAEAKGDSAVAIGNSSYADQNNSMAIGNASKAEKDSAIALGNTAKASGNQSVAIGNTSEASADSAVALGNSAKAAEKDATALGNNTKATGENSTAVGNSAIAGGINSEAIGTGTATSGMFSTVNGAYSKVGKMGTDGTYTAGSSFQGATASVYGTMNTVDTAGGNFDGVANSIVGTVNTTKNANGSLVFGAGNSVSNSYGDVDSQTISRAAALYQQGKIEEAKQFLAGAVASSGGAALVIGGANTVDGASLSQVVGVSNRLAGTESTKTKQNLLNGYKNTGSNVSNVSVIGSSNTVSDGSFDIVIGDNHKLTGASNTVVLGSSDNEQETTVSDAVLIGHNAKAAQKGDVALGADSETAAAVATTSASINGETKNFAGTAPVATVSVGAAGKERTITNVAAGRVSASSTDAINGSQLFGVVDEVNKGVKYAGDVQDTSSTTNAFTQRLGAQTNIVGGVTNTANLTDNNIGVVSNGKDTLTVKLKKNIDLGTDGSVKMGDTTVNDNGVTITGGPSITKAGGINAGDKQVTHVASGGDVETNGANIGDVKNAVNNATTNITNSLTEKGFGLKAEDGQNVHKKLGEDVEVVGDGKNISTKVEEGKVKVVLKDDININSVTAKTINGDTIKAGNTVTINHQGADMGGTKVTNLKDGDISAASKDAVNGSQLYKTNEQVAANTQNINNIGGAVNNLDKRVNRVGAGAAALAALHPLDFDPDDKWDVAAGYGNYKDADAVAIGAFYRPNEDTMFSVGGSFGGGENMVNAGVSVKLGQGNHVSTSRVAMAKEIKDLKKDVAALKAVVNQQSALIDKLTGVNAGELSGSDDLFPDVPANHWAYEYVTRLKQAGILTGYPDGNFAGDRMMTRYEFAAIVYRAIMAGAAANPSLNKDGTLDRLSKEFSSEMKYIRIDTIRKDRNGRPTIQRVRVIKEDEKEK